MNPLLGLSKEELKKMFSDEDSLKFLNKLAEEDTKNQNIQAILPGFLSIIGLFLIAFLLCQIGNK